MKVIKYNNTYKTEYKALVRKLWNDIEETELDSIIDYHLSGKERIFLALDKETCIGFLNTSIRTDYVEGSTTNEVGYIEGIYIEETYRKQGIGKKLLEEADQYFLSIGIKEVGSDVEMGNTSSELFHNQVGFTEAGRNIHFIKTLTEKK